MPGGVDWNHPQLTDNYDDVLDIYIVGRDIDAITLMKSAPSNLPDGAIAYDRSTDLFKEWSTGGAAFVNKKLAVAGGGTGADNASQARTNLGLGSMAVQDSNAVTITGGSVSGITLNASVITAGVVAIARGGTGASLALGSAGTVLQSDGAGVVFGTDGSALINLNGSNISSGTISAARLPAAIGAVSQLVDTRDTTRDNTQSTSYVASTLHVTITPGDSSKRVLVLGTFRLSTTVGGGQTLATADVALYRSIGGGSYSQIAILGTSLGYQISTSGSNAPIMFHVQFVDSPATTSAIDYKIYFKTNNSANSVDLGWVNSDGRVLDALEVI